MAQYTPPPIMDRIMEVEAIKDLSMFGIRAVAVNFSMTCNLRCSYCYLTKEPSIMPSLNRDTIDWITSGRMEDDLLKITGSGGLDYLSLWGGEPTLNLFYLIGRLESIYQKFHNLKWISLSTNLATDPQLEVLIDWAKSIERLNSKFDRNITARIQISIDGPSELGNERKGSVPEDILSRAVKLVYALKDCKCTDFAFKGTHDSESLLKLQEEENLVRHYSFFDEYYHEVEQFTKRFPICGEYVSYVYPGDYSTIHGKAAARMLSIMTSEDFKNRPWKSHSLTFEDQSLTRFFDLSRLSVSTRCRDSRERKVTCSAGLGELSIDCYGNIHLCHNSFFYNEEVEKIISKFQFQGSSGIDYSKQKIFLKGKYIIPNTDTLRTLRIMNNMNQYKKTPSMTIQCYEMLIREMALLGQIDEKYAYREKDRTLATAYMSMSSRLCPSSSISEFGSPFLQDTSHIKLFLNGVLDECVKEAQRRLNK